MKGLSAFILGATCLSACVPPSPAPVLLAGDLEPAISQVTAGKTGADRDPHVTRDGRLLFFASTAYGEHYEIYVKTIGSNTCSRATTLPGDKRFPSTNPADPRMLAFASNARGAWEIYLLEDYAARPAQAVVLSEPGTENLHPSWSPDGRMIAYCSTRDLNGGSWGLRVKDLSTGRIHVLEGVDGLLPQWAPSGRRLVFQRMKQRDGWMSAIWTVDFEDGAARNLTSVYSSDEGAAINPSWSPDGRYIVFATVAQSRAHAGMLDQADDLWRVEADGANPTRLTSSPAADWMPCWSVDGRIFFISDRGGAPRIWSLPAR